MSKGVPILAIIQARMGSTRLPGKVLLPIIDGKGSLELMLERVSRSKTIDKIVVATTTNARDNPIEELCKRLSYACHRGSEDDVLDRYYEAAKAHGPADAIVRLTADCPLHDPEVIDAVVKEFQSKRPDYTSNVSPRTYPDGLDTEVFDWQALHDSWEVGKDQYFREHVTTFIRKHPDRFRIANVKALEDFSTHRWTLDRHEDLLFVKAVFQRFYKNNPAFGMQEVLAFEEARPEIRRVNEHIKRGDKAEDDQHLTVKTEGSE